MAYQTGTAANIADVQAAFLAFLSAAGWTVAGNIASSPGGCHAQIGSADGGLTLLGGTGVAGSALTGAGPAITRARALLTGEPITYPATWEAHAHGDEAFLFLTWGGGDKWLHIGFGKSPVAGLPGTGCWYFGSSAQAPTPGMYYAANFNMGYPGTPNVSENATGPFWVTGNQPANSYVHHGLDGNTWTQSTGGVVYPPPNGAHAFGCISPLLVRGANAFNGEAPLLPVRPYIGRPSGKLSVVAQLQAMRYVNIKNLSPQQVLTIGTDKWRVYPFYKKGGTLAPTNTDTGWLGMAVRYDGA